jgi:hypothetical protein
VLSDDVENLRGIKQKAAITELCAVDVAAQQKVENHRMQRNKTVYRPAA